MAKGQNPTSTSRYRTRRSFAKIPDVMDVPNLIAVQTESFEWFKTEGLDQAFASISPIENSTKDMVVEFGKHEFGEPKYTVDECKEKDVSYQAPLFVEIRFINKETGEIKEQEVFMGDFPLMTPRGTFIINGTERVVVSQLVRSPGVYFSTEVDKTSPKTIYNAKIIPSRGAWLEFETDKRDVLHVRIDRRRKQPATLLVRALGLAETREEIIDLLGASDIDPAHARPRPRNHPRGIAHRAVQALPSRRAAHARLCPHASRRPVLQPAALRLGCRRSLQDQQEAAARPRKRLPDPHRGRHRQNHEVHSCPA